MGSYYGGCIACDSNGSIYSVGMCQRYGDYPPLFHVASYDVYGNLQWEMYPAAPAGVTPFNTRAATIADGALYILATGLVTSSTTDAQRKVAVVYQISLDGSSVKFNYRGDNAGNIVGSALLVGYGEVYVIAYEEPGGSPFTYLGPNDTKLGTYPANNLVGLEFDETTLGEVSGTTLLPYINAPLDSGSEISVRADYAYAVFDPNGNIQIAANGSNVTGKPASTGFADGIVMSCYHEGITPFQGPVRTRMEGSSNYDLGDNIVGLGINGDNLYVGAKAYIGSRWQFNVEKFNVADNKLAEQYHLTPLRSSGNGQPQSLLVTAAGGIAITGNYTSPPTYATFLLSDTGTALKQKWAETALSWPGNYQVGATSLASDAEGFLYCLYGNSAGAPLIYKYDSSGDVIWSKAVTEGPGLIWNSPNPATDNDYFDSNLVVDPFGNIDTCLTSQSPVEGNNQRSPIPQMWTIQLMNGVVAAGASYYISNEALLNVAADNGLLRHSYYTQGAVCSVVSPPSHGYLSLGGDGSFFYVPDSTFAGVDEFTYSATKSSLAEDIPVTSDPATVNIYIEPAVATLSVPQAIVGHSKATVTERGVVALASAVPSGGSSVTVQLTAATLPSYPSYTIPAIPAATLAAGTQSAGFQLTIPSITNGSIVKVTATSSIVPYAGADPITNTVSSLVTVFPDISSTDPIDFGSTSVKAGLQNAQAVVNLAGETVAPVNTQLFTSNHSALYFQDYNVTIPNGASSASISYSTGTVTSATTVTVTVQEVDTTTKYSKAVTVEPAAPEDFARDLSNIETLDSLDTDQSCGSNPADGGDILAGRARGIIKQRIVEPGTVQYFATHRQIASGVSAERAMEMKGVFRKAHPPNAICGGPRMIRVRAYPIGVAHIGRVA